jgi:hypothetical protein
MTWKKKRFFGHHGLGMTLYGASGVESLKYEDQRFSIFSALEYLFFNGFSVIAQVVAASAVADYPELDEPVIEVIIGFKKKIGSGVLEFCLIENMLYFNNSPDGGIQIGYTFYK